MIATTSRGSSVLWSEDTSYLQYISVVKVPFLLYTSNYARHGFFTRGGYFTWRNHIILPFYGVRFIFAACLHHRSSFKPDCSNFFFKLKKKAKRLIKRFFTKNRYAPDYTRYVNRVIDSDISLKAYSNKLHVRSNF